MVSSGLRDTVAYTIAQLGLIYNLHLDTNDDCHQALKN
jgi:hypothetical protein